MKVAGLPHSEIAGSKLVDSSPTLIAVFRVLHSLLMPRHPSCARIRLARKSFPFTSLISFTVVKYLAALYTIYKVVILFNFQLPVFKEQCSYPQSGEQVHIIPYISVRTQAENCIWTKIVR